MSEDSRQPDPSRVTVSTSDTVAPERRLFGYLSRQFSGTMVSRVLGFARELVTSFYFGASAAADAFIAALTIPTLFRDILGEDVVDRAVMPGVRERLARGEHQQAWLFSSAALTWMILGMTATMALVYLTAPWLVQVVAGGIHQRTVDEGTVADVINMTRILVPFIMFIALAAFVGGLLYYCYDLHLPYSLAPAMLSVGVIASLVFFTEKYGVYALAIGFVGGAALQLLVQVPFLRSRTVRETQPRYIPILRFPDGSGKRVARETGYIALQSVLTKTTEVVDRRVASFLAAGGISSLYFAARLIQLPIGIIGNGISRSVAPYLSERVGLDDRPGFKHAVLIGYRYNLLFILPLTALFIVLAEPIVRLVYMRGQFTEQDVQSTALAFWCYGTGLFGMSMYSLGSRVCSALNRNKVATITSTVGAAINIWLNYELSATALRHGGLALATSIGFSVNALLIFIWLHRHLVSNNAGFTFAELFAPALRVLLNSAVAALAAWYAYATVSSGVESMSAPGFLAQAASVGIALGAGTSAYALMSVVNPIPETAPVIRRLKSLLHR